jgi:hypothetical protein
MVGAEYDYVGAVITDKKSGDKNELPFENNGTSLLSLMAAPT